MKDENLASSSVHGNVLVMQIDQAHIQDPDLSLAVRDRLIELADEAGLTKLVIDFSAVTFMGSIGFLALMSLRRHVADGRIILCGLNDRLEAMCKAARLVPSEKVESAVFEQTETVDQALAVLGIDT